MKTNIFKSIYNTLENYVKRFSGVLIASVVTAIIFVIHSIVNEYSFVNVEKVFMNLFKCGCMGIAFSVFCGIFTELILRKNDDNEKVRKISFISQLGGIVFSFFPMYFLCRLNSNHALLIYGCLIGAVVILCGFFLTIYQNEENIVQNVWEAILLSWGTAIVICAGAGLILAAINYFFVSIDDFILEAVIGFLGIIILVNVFVAYGTSKKENVSLSKLYKITVKYILFSLYAALVLILYAYLIKCAFERNVPVHTNLFVSSAVLAFLFFSFTLLKYKEEKVVGFFYKFGYLFLIPLVIIQIITFFIRVNDYGFTGWRVSSLYYILFSVIVLILAAIKSGKYMKLSLPVFSLLLIILSCSPFNPVTFPVKEQMARINKILEPHGYVLSKDLAITDGTSIFTEEEKAKIVDLYFYLGSGENAPEWLQFTYKDRDEKFKSLFGFKYDTTYNSHSDKYYFITCSASNLDMDISEYKEIKEVSKVEAKQVGVDVKLIDCDDNEYDVSDFITEIILKAIELNEKYEIETPLVIHYDNKSDIVVTGIELTFENLDSEITIRNKYIKAFILKK